MKNKVVLFVTLISFFCGNAIAGGFLTINGNTYDQSTGHTLASTWAWGSKNTLDIWLQSDQEHIFEFVFAAPDGEILIPGTYTEFGDYDMYGDPSSTPLTGLWLEGSIPNRVEITGGQVDVLDIVWGDNGRPLFANVNFEFTTDSEPVTGSLLFTTKGIPEPSPSLLAIGALALIGLTNRKRQ